MHRPSFSVPVTALAAITASEMYMCSKARSIPRWPDSNAKAGSAPASSRSTGSWNKKRQKLAKYDVLRGCRACWLSGAAAMSSPVTLHLPADPAPTRALPVLPGVEEDPYSRWR